MIYRIDIENFRSIKKLEFFPEKLCGLIGPNSTGKTNILKAIDLVLGEGWTTKAKVAKELFNDPNKPIKIEIEFDRPIKYEYYGNNLEGTSVILNMSLEPTLECSVKIMPGDKFINEDFKNKCNFVYIPSQRDLVGQMRVSSWTMLGKIMKEIHSNYIKNKGGEDELKKEFKEKIKEAKDFIEDNFDSSVLTFDRFKKTFEDKCKDNSIGLANQFSPELNIYNLNWFYKTLQIQVTENNGIIFDAEELGSGMQNLILISIFQTYAELMKGKVIFGIEEPEIFLYPQAQRSLFNSFKELSKNTQIFYTTHSVNFVDPERSHELEILKKDVTNGTYREDKNDVVVTKDFLKDHKFQIYTHFNTCKNEIFFSKKILLVEGVSDKILFQTLAENIWSINLDLNGIVIIDCGGKEGVKYFTGVCTLLGLNYFSVWDKDSKNLDPGNMADKLLIDSISSNKGLELDNKLEDVLKKYDPTLILSSVSDKKVKQSYDWAFKTTGWPEEFNIVKSFLED